MVSFAYMIPFDGSILKNWLSFYIGKVLSYNSISKLNSTSKGVGFDKRNSRFYSLKKSALNIKSSGSYSLSSSHKNNYGVNAVAMSWSVSVVLSRSVIFIRKWKEPASLQLSCACISVELPGSTKAFIGTIVRSTGYPYSCCDSTKISALSTP